MTPEERNALRARKEGQNEDIVTLDSLSLQILSKECVLFIGNEAILTTNSKITDNDACLGNCEGDAGIYFYNLMKQDSTKDIEDCKGMTENEWLKYYANKEIEILNRYQSTASNHYYNLDIIEPTLRLLLETKKFPLVFTTSTNRYLETLMEDIYGDINTYTMTNKKHRELFIKDITKWEKKLSVPEMPTLIYMFGRVNDKNASGKDTDIVYNDDTAIEKISHWIRSAESNHEDHKIYEYLKKKKIIAIGCDNNDWRFRFFWYAIRGSIDSMGMGKIAITNPDKNLKEYLELKNLLHSEGSRQFMRDLASSLEQMSVEYYRNSEDKFIFISYAHEDLDWAQHIFYYLYNQGYKVWLDKRELRSGNYDEIINDKLSRCSVVMPILSKQVTKDLTNKNFDRYYIKEEWGKIHNRIKLQPQEVNQSLEDNNPNILHVVPIMIDDSPRKVMAIIEKKLGVRCNALSIEQIDIVKLDCDKFLK